MERRSCFGSIGADADCLRKNADLRGVMTRSAKRVIVEPVKVRANPIRMRWRGFAGSSTEIAF
jgi:hypothetical protein